MKFKILAALILAAIPMFTGSVSHASSNGQSTLSLGVETPTSSFIKQYYGSTWFLLDYSGVGDATKPGSAWYYLDLAFGSGSSNTTDSEDNPVSISASVVTFAAGIGYRYSFSSPSGGSSSSSGANPFVEAGVQIDDDAVDVSGSGSGGIAEVVGSNLGIGFKTGVGVTFAKHLTLEADYVNESSGIGIDTINYSLGYTF